MAKRIMFCLAIVVLAASGAFAQEEPVEQAPEPARAPQASQGAWAVAMDVFPTFKGIVASNDEFLAFNISFAYERSVAGHFSIGPDIELYYMNIETMNGSCLYFSVAAEGRYYPSANYNKFFLGTTLGLNILSIDGSIKTQNGGFAGLTTSLKTGYKLVISNRFYMEPSLAYVLSKYSTLPTPSGWEGGLRLGYTL